jgi:acyl carrier protein
MDRQEQIIQAIFGAIAEVNETLEPDKTLAPSTETILIGESSTLDSLGFITLVTAVEENVERIFDKTISMMDVIVALQPEWWTVANMAECIAELVDGGPQE